MFDGTSRYSALETSTLTVTDASGETREIAYVRRRFAPSTDGQVVLARHRVTQGERIDNIAAIYAGDPTQFWRICDANDALDPLDLTVPPGRIIIVAMAT